MRSCLSWEEDQGLSNGRKAKVRELGRKSSSPGLGWSWEGKFIQRACRALGLAQQSRAPCSPNPKCVLQTPGTGGWAGPVCRDNNGTLCCLVTPCPRNPFSFRPLSGLTFPYLSCASSASHPYSPFTFFVSAFPLASHFILASCPFQPLRFFPPLTLSWPSAASIFSVLVFTSDQPFFSLALLGLYFFSSPAL